MEAIDMLKQSVHYDERLHCITQNLDVNALKEMYDSKGNMEYTLKTIIMYALRRKCYELCSEGLINNKVYNIIGFDRGTVNNYCNEYREEFPKT